MNLRSLCIKFDLNLAAGTSQLFDTATGQFGFVQDYILADLYLNTFYSVQTINFVDFATQNNYKMILCCQKDVYRIYSFFIGPKTIN